MSSMPAGLYAARFTPAWTILPSALSCEPETIDELQDAIAGLIKLAGGGRIFDMLHDGINTKPWDAGIICIDRRRVVAIESTCSMPAPAGKVRYHDGERATRMLLPCEACDDWLYRSDSIRLPHRAKTRAADL
jgi:hypothetical protein